MLEACNVLTTMRCIHHTTTLIDAKKYDLRKIRLNDLITGIYKKSATNI